MKGFLLKVPKCLFCNGRVRQYVAVDFSTLKNLSESIVACQEVFYFLIISFLVNVKFETSEDVVIYFLYLMQELGRAEKLCIFVI